MGKVSDVIKKILSLGTIEQEKNNQKSNVPEITNKILLQELVTHFEQVMDKKSVGRRI